MTTPADEPRTRRLFVKAFKFALAAVAVALLVSAAVLAYLALTFDARDYRAHIVRFVHDQTGRTLHIDGALRLSVWPHVARNVQMVLK